VARLPQPRLMHHVILSITTNTFVPREVISGSDDRRELGISLGSIALGRRRRDYRPRMDSRPAWPQRWTHWLVGRHLRRAA
jgi:hypothetical protein